MIKKVINMIKLFFYFLFLLGILGGLLSWIIDFSGLNDYLVYGLGLPIGAILIIANKNNLNSDLLSKKTGIETTEYFSFNPFSPSPKKMEISYKDGKIDGRRAQWYKNGQKMAEGSCKDGKPDGKGTFWYENGQIKEEVNFKDDELDGKETWWYKNGKKEREVNYKDGELDGKSTWWHEDGWKQQEGNFIDGKEDGMRTQWYENGQKAQECNFNNDKQDGKWTSWHENGQIFEEATFKDGKCISGDCPKKLSPLVFGFFIVALIVIFIKRL